MFRTNFFQWFENLKTQAKLLTVFGLVGVIIAAMAGVGIVTNGRLSAQAETVYLDYTVPLTEFNQLLFNVNRYHESLVDVARTPRASDFEIELKDIAPYRAEIERLISSYEKTTLRTSSTGRDEAKDLAELKTALSEFFGQGDAAIGTIKESFENKSLSSGQALAMRELGALAITVSLSPAFEKVTQRHAEQIKTMSEVAKDLSDRSEGHGVQRDPDSGRRRCRRRAVGLGPRLLGGPQTVSGYRTWSPASPNKRRAATIKRAPRSPRRTSWVRWRPRSTPCWTALRPS